MTSDPLSVSGRLADWATDLTAEVVTDLAPSRIRAIADYATLGGVGAAAGVTTSSILQGGAQMTTMTTTASAVAGLKTKIAAGTLAVAMAAGGAAAVTGNLPDGAQRIAADIAAHVGLELPTGGATADLRAGATLNGGDIVSVEALGEISAVLTAEGLSLGEITTEAGASAMVKVDTPERLVVELSNGVEGATVVITHDGEDVVSSITHYDVAVDAAVSTLECADIGADADAAGSASLLGGTVGAVIGGTSSLSVPCPTVDASASLSVTGNAGTGR